MIWDDPIYFNFCLRSGIDIGSSDSDDDEEEDDDSDGEVEISDRSPMSGRQMSASRRWFLPKRLA